MYKEGESPEQPQVNEGLLVLNYVINPAPEMSREK